MPELVFLKLGGSLITDKTRPYTPRLDKLADLAGQIASALSADAGLRLLVGHGSGSFGHTAAQQYGTRQGVRDARGWRGFSEVAERARELNDFVMHALHMAGIPAMSFPPSAAVVASHGQVSIWESTPIRMALANRILPVVYGDVAFDEVRGGTILSTEDLFTHLAKTLLPQRILLAGLEEGVWADFPARTRRVEEITPASFREIQAGVGKAAGADVTGGMESKVKQMLDLVDQLPGMTAEIFSGETAGSVARALGGIQVGTLIRGD